MSDAKALPPICDELIRAAAAVYIVADKEVADSIADTIRRAVACISDVTNERDAARRFADYAARHMVEQFCTSKKRGVWDYGICGPLVSPAFDYLKSCGRIEYIGNGRVRIEEAPK